MEVKMPFYYHIIAIGCFFGFGFVVVHIPESVSPLWAVPWTLLVAIPAIFVGAWVGLCH
jgi:hypothetical protein